MRLNILCYKENKLIYNIELCMSEKRLTKQIHDGVLTYTNKNKGVEIINLRQFDKVVLPDFWNFDLFEKEK